MFRRTVTLALLGSALPALAQPQRPTRQQAARILRVGLGQSYARLSAAVAAARDGDTIRVQAGTYVNDFATINRRIAIIGVGGMARLVATIPPPNGKAILTSTTDLQLQNIEFTGAKVRDRNGAGIRYEGGDLAVVNCYFHANESHILAAASPRGTIQIRDCEFARHVPPDDQAHSIYIGNIARLEVRDSFFHDGVNGNMVKSRARRTVITGSRVYDEDGEVSYSIDLPNGGIATITDNVIVQGPNSPNRAIISFATESAPYPGSSLTVENNTILNFGGRGTGILNRSGLSVTFSRNRLHALTTNVMGPSSQSGNEIIARPPALDRSRPWRAPST
jgi:hypothetical protein